MAAKRRKERKSEKKNDLLAFAPFALFCGHSSSGFAFCGCSDSSSYGFDTVSLPTVERATTLRSYIASP